MQSKLFFNFSNGLAYFDGKKLENIVSNKTQPDNSLSVLDKTFCVGHSGMHPLETSKLSSSDTLSHGIRIKQEIFINHEHVEDTFWSILLDIHGLFTSFNIHLPTKI